MNRKIALVIIALACSLFAAPVSEESAMSVAQNWFSLRNPVKAGDRQITSSSVTKEANTNLFYTFNFQSGGFVIVAADDASIPILGYSYSSAAPEDVSNTPIGFWLDRYKNQMSTIIKNSYSNATTLPQWSKILDSDITPYNSTPSVGPLLESKWGQESPYNSKIPKSYPVGSIVTAMGQVMNYYQWPIKGNGTKAHPGSVNGTGVNLTADFAETTYEWPKMTVPMLTGSSAGATAATNTMLLHLGIATTTKFSTGISTSTTANALSAFKSNFRYTNTANIKNRLSYTASEWYQLLRAELDLLMPVYYSITDLDMGADHAFVCDGYTVDDNKFHFNWGFNGNYNGYYEASMLNPNLTNSFISSQQAIFGLWDYYSTPSPVYNISVQSYGDGKKIKVTWDVNPSSEKVVKYRVGFDETSCGYTTYKETTSNSLIIDDLKSDVTYFLSVSGITAKGMTSKVEEITFKISETPETPSDFYVAPAANEITLSWSYNSELDTAGYNVYSGTDPSNMQKVNSALIKKSTFTVSNPPKVKTYFKVSAVDKDNNESPFSEILYGRPATLDLGVLVVNDSPDGSGTPYNPTIAMQKEFYDQVLANVTNKSSLDVLPTQTVVTSDFCAYSTVIWHNINAASSAAFSLSKEEIAKYLDLGGKIIVITNKPAHLAQRNEIYPIKFHSVSFASKYLGIDSAYYEQVARSSGATPVVDNYNILRVDATKTFSSYNNHIKNLETFAATPSAKIIYRFDSEYLLSENFGTEKGKPVGLEVSNATFKAITLAMPLYYIEKNDVKKLLEYILEGKFGETLGPVGIDKKPAMQNAKLQLVSSRNPFNTLTQINFFNPASQKLNLAVYNWRGELVSKLIDNRELPAGYNSINLDTKDLSSGVYFYRLNSNKEKLTGKLMLLK